MADMYVKQADGSWSAGSNIPVGGGGGGGNPLLQGASGLPWNSCLSGRMGALTEKRAEWEAWLGKPVDGIEHFNTRSTWSNMAWVDPDIISMPGYRILTMPSQPQGPAADQDNTLGASGTYNYWWRDFGTWLSANGMNNDRTIIRLNHEPNPSSYAWHPWHWGAPNVATFVQSFYNAAYSVRETAPNIMISVNHARGHFDTSYTGGLTWGQCVDQLMNFTDSHGRYLVNLVTQDSYNNSPGVTPNGVVGTEAQRLANWRQQTNGVDSDTPPGRAEGFGIPCRGTAYAFCEDWTAQRGEPVYFWHHEWGLSHRDDSNGGDDDPYFIQYMWDWFQARAVGNGGLMLGESYFNDIGAPSTNMHSVYDYDIDGIPAHNANAGAVFQSLWSS